MNEKPAKNVEGFLLYNPFTEKYFFRIYDSVDKKKYIDYKICAEDVKVEIKSNILSLYEERYDKEGNKINCLDWSNERHTHCGCCTCLPNRFLGEFDSLMPH